MRADRTIIKRYGLNGQPGRIPRFWGKLGELEESSERDMAFKRRGGTPYRERAAARCGCPTESNESNAWDQSRNKILWRDVE